MLRLRGVIEVNRSSFYAWDAAAPAPVDRQGADTHLAEWIRVVHEVDNKRRGATVEPGIGNLKKIIDCFSRRGLDNATSELHMAATVFNLMKVHRATPAA